MSDGKWSVEYTAKYATVVDEINEAFVFIMAHLDKVGAEPSIWITPMWLVDHALNDDGEQVHVSVCKFEVVVSGSFEDLV